MYFNCIVWILTNVMINPPDVYRWLALVLVGCTSRASAIGKGVTQAALPGYLRRMVVTTRLGLWNQ